MDVMSNLKSMSFTGNVYFDSIILAHALPLLVTYSQQLMGLFRYVLMWLMGVCAHWLHERVNTRVVGTVVANVNINVGDSLYEALRETVFLSEKYRNNTGLHSKYGEMMDVENLEAQEDEKKGDMAWWWRMRSPPISNEMITLSCLPNDPLIFSSDVVKDNSSKSIMYQPADSDISFLFTFSMLKSVIMKKDKDDKDANKEFIKMRVRAFGGNGLLQDSDFIGKIIKRFLMEELSIMDHILYTHKVKVLSSTITHKIEDWVMRNRMSYGNHHIKYGTPMTNMKAISERISGFSITVDGGALQNDNDNSQHLRWSPETVESTGRSKVMARCFISGWSPYFDFVRDQFRNRSIHDGNYAIALVDNKFYLICRTLGDCTYFGVACEGTMPSSEDIKKVVNDFINHCFNTTVTVPKKQTRSLYHYQNSEWVKMSLDVRSMSTLYLHPDVSRQLTTSIDTFFKLKDLHKRIHLTYKMGILLYGPPGTGKTSTVRTLAHHYGMDVYMLDVNCPSINDNNIASVLNALASHSEAKILVMEDIDSAFADTEAIATAARITATEKPRQDAGSQKKGGAGDNPPKEEAKERPQERVSFLTYSGLLQALDGLNSHQTGLITIMTTNHIEKLGDAVMREGRVDHKIYMGECCHAQIVAMLTTILGEYAKLTGTTIPDMDARILQFATRLCHRGKVQREDGCDIAVTPTDPSPIKPCTLQTYILSNILDTDGLFEGWSRLVPEGV